MVTSGHQTSYAGHRLDLRESRLRKLLRLLEGEPRGRLLDVGCAGCELAAVLVALGWQVEGVEREPALVEAARDRGLLAFPRHGHRDEGQEEPGPACILLARRSAGEPSE